MTAGSKSIKILGISESHCATAALLVDGKIIACASEERFVREKNIGGFPKKSIEYVLKEGNIDISDIDLIIFSFKNPTLHWRFQGEFFESPLAGIFDLVLKTGFSFSALARLYAFLNDNLYQKITWSMLRKKQIADIIQKTGVKKEKVHFIDHHLAHAYSSFCLPVSGKKFGIITTDGAGDATCGLVGIFEKNGNLKVVTTVPNRHSLGGFYTSVTQHLGMKIYENEYKVMALASYADKKGEAELYQKIRDLFYVDKKNLRFASKFFNPSYPLIFAKLFRYQRFDWIAGATQKLLETILLEWTQVIINKLKLSEIVFAGGVFLNVKANMLLANIVRYPYFVPSPGDESSAIGAAFWGYQNLCREKKIAFDPQPLSNLYLGPSCSEREIRDTLNKKEFLKKYKVKKVDNIESHLAKLLSEGKIVARFAGRMEWGARALGNRSILANPSIPGIARAINEQIKGRDFWMPFAPTILHRRQHDYIVNPKNIEAPCMILAFESTERARRELVAAIHPYDFTCRPQILKEEDNPKYFKIIKEFERLTGIGGVLNTSFNIHGDAIVCSPQDATYTFENSGLEYLALENYLVSKQ